MARSRSPAGTGAGGQAAVGMPPTVTQRALSVSRAMLPAVEYVFDARLWVWDARKADSWTFVRLPEDVSDEVRELAAGPRRGFGAVRVRARIGATVWRTSIFPGSDAYVLPVKRAVRRAESIEAGDVATVALEVLEF